MNIEHFTSNETNYIIVDQYKKHTRMHSYKSSEALSKFNSTIGVWNVKYKK